MPDYINWKLLSSTSKNPHHIMVYKDHITITYNKRYNQVFSGFKVSTEFDFSFLQKTNSFIFNREGKSKESNP